MEFFIKQMFFLLQVAGAMLLGAMIGLERKLRYKEAGLRTHALVSGGACLLMIVSKHGFSGNFDGARVAAQIVTGIGFLGAGMIMYKKHSIQGLTTAAGIWVTAGIGMSVGGELYYLSVGATLVIVTFQFVMHLDIKFLRSKEFFTYKVNFYSKADEQTRIKDLFGVKDYYHVSLNYEQDKLVCSGYIRSDKIKSDIELKEIMEKNDYIISVEKVSN
jgi:putative Mg2+ transporter-C (MgtC) family protein